ncbi:MAG: anaerobic ribonucleoside-triphosphate reductase activating protein [Aeromonadaceae bacterium]
MKYHRLYKTDMVNGEGVRVTLFVGGCDHACKGCYNKSTWNPDNGYPFTEGVRDQIIKALNRSWVRGLSLTGGDPLYHGNLFDILQLILDVRKVYGESKDIWLWTGYTRDEIENSEWSVENMLRQEILSHIDVLVDGKFEQDKQDPELAFRGSSNQIIHRMKV